MVFKRSIDAEARQDVHILSQHYKGTNATLRRRGSGNISRASYSTPAVVSLGDLSIERRLSEQKRGIATLWSILRSRSSKVEDRREQRSTKNYVIENYERDTQKIVRTEGINPIVGASSQALVDGSDDDSCSLEPELEQINEDVGSACQSTGSSLPPSHVQIDNNMSKEDPSLVTGELATATDDPWSFFLWFFGCSDESMWRGRNVVGKRNYARGDVNLNDYRDDVPASDGESQYTDYTRTVSEADHSRYLEAN